MMYLDKIDGFYAEYNALNDTYNGNLMSEIMRDENVKSINNKDEFDMFDIIYDYPVYAEALRKICDEINKG